MNNENPIEKNPVLFFGIDYPFIGERLCYSWNEIFPLSKMKFENGMFYVPHDWDSHLKRIYGKNYMLFPKKYNFDDLLKDISEDD